MLLEPGTAFDARVRLPMGFRPATLRPAHLTDRYNDVLATNETREASFDELLDGMNKSGVGAAIMHAEYEFGDPADELNSAVAAVVADHPGRFVGFGTISLEHFRIEVGVRQIEAIARLGLRGVNLQPAFFGMPLDDRRLYPVYWKAAELGLIVALHTGVNYSSRDPIRNEQPILLDQVACDFPELKLVACHAGWPWVAEMVAVARRHPSIMLDTGGWAPRYLGAPGAGWDVLMRYMDTLLSDQVMFATDWPVISMQRSVDELAQLPLKPATLEKVMCGNAARLLGVETAVLGA